MLSAADKKYDARDDVTENLDIVKLLTGSDDFLTEDTKCTTVASPLLKSFGSSPLGLYAASRQRHVDDSRRESMNLFPDMSVDNFESLENVSFDFRNLSDQSPERSHSSTASVIQQQASKAIARRSLGSQLKSRSSLSTSMALPFFSNVLETPSSNLSPSSTTHLNTHSHIGKRSRGSSYEMTHAALVNEIPSSSFSSPSHKLPVPIKSRHSYAEKFGVDENESIPRSLDEIPVPLTKIEHEPFAMFDLQQALPSADQVVDHDTTEDSDDASMFDKTITQEMSVGRFSLQRRSQLSNCSTESDHHTKEKTHEEINDNTVDENDQTILGTFNNIHAPHLSQDDTDDDWLNVNMGFFHQPDVGKLGFGRFKDDHHTSQSAPLRIEELSIDNTNPSQKSMIATFTNSRRSTPGVSTAYKSRTITPNVNGVQKQQPQLSLSERLNKIKTAHTPVVTLKNSISTPGNVSSLPTSKTTPTSQSKNVSPAASTFPYATRLRTPETQSSQSTVEFIGKKPTILFTTSTKTLKRTVDIRSPAAFAHKEMASIPEVPTRSMRLFQPHVSKQTSHASIFTMSGESDSKSKMSESINAGDSAKRIKLSPGLSSTKQIRISKVARSVPLVSKVRLPGSNTTSKFPQPFIKSLATNQPSTTTSTSSLLSRLLPTSADSITGLTVVDSQNDAKKPIVFGPPRLAASSLIPGKSNLPQPSQSLSSQGRLRVGSQETNRSISSSGISRLKQPCNRK